MSEKQECNEIENALESLSDDDKIINESDEFKIKDIFTKRGPPVLPRIIETARTIKEMSIAEENGYKLCIEMVVPSPDISIREVFIRNKDTGEITTQPYDYYAVICGTQDNTEILKIENRYPYDFPSDIAAYLIPPDLEIGERVILEDLIEDIVGADHSEGTYRLRSAEAIWDGKQFVVDHDSYTVPVTMG